MDKNDNKSNPEMGFVLVIGDRVHKIIKPISTFSGRVFSINTNITGCFNKLKAVYLLIKILSFQSNLVTITDYPGILAMFSIVYSRLLGKKFVLRLRGDIWKEIPQWNSGLSLAFRQAIANYLTLNSDLVLPVSCYLASVVQERFPVIAEKVFPIYVPFEDVFSVSQYQLPEAIQRIFEEHSGNEILVTVTNFDFIGKVQGLREFLPIFRELIYLRNKKIVWFIGGRGRNLPAFREEVFQDPSVNEHIRILGYVKPSSALFAKADLVVYFTYEDGFPNVVIEAQLTGKTVLVNSFGPLKEQVDSGKTGFILEPLDKESSLELILHLLEDSVLRNRIGQQAREYALEMYSNRRIGEDYKKTLSNLMCSSVSNR